MSKASYLQALTQWTRAGSQGHAPSSAAHGFNLSDVASDEAAAARDAGDPRPPAVSNWTWWDGTHKNLHAWHSAIRAVYQGGVMFTTEERQRAEFLYRQTAQEVRPWARAKACL